MYAFAPDGSMIIGTLERTPGCALTVDGAFTRQPDGSLDYDHEGETEMWWDDQTTRSTATGETIFVDKGYRCWSESEVVLSDDPNWQPEETTQPPASGADTAEDTLRATAKDLVAAWDAFDDTGPQPLDALIEKLRSTLKTMEG